MAHAFPGRGGLTRDERHHRLADVVFDVLGRRLFVGAPDLADHDDRVGLFVVLEHVEQFDEVKPLDRIATDAHAR